MAIPIQVDDRIWQLRPDFAVLVIVARHMKITGDASSEESVLALKEASRWAVESLNNMSPKEHPHVLAWREAYRQFGAKPQRTPSSVEALLTRAVAGDVPSIGGLVDFYNAVSIRFALPAGGEDLDKIQSPMMLTIADGTEKFETVAGGEAVVETVPAGEVIWKDNLGVTCRRWNWRQGTRTRITPDTTNTIFVLERLEPMPMDQLHAAGEELERHIRSVCKDASIEKVTLSKT